MYYHMIKEEQRYFENHIENLQTQLEVLPDGSIAPSRTNSYVKWIHHNKGRTVTIKNTNHQLIVDLAYKKYLTCLLSEAKTELNAVNAYLDRHDFSEKKSEQMLKVDSPYRALLAERFADLPADEKEWINAPFKTNNLFPETLKFEVTSGLLVRSKSEALIAESLLQSRIPFRYECALELGNATYYPDFTIMHPGTKQIFYWEHLGLMDSPDYVQKNYRKLAVYAEHGISPLTSLILTYEDLNHPLSQATVHSVISQNFSNTIR